MQIRRADLGLLVSPIHPGSKGPVQVWQRLREMTLCVYTKKKKNFPKKTVAIGKEIELMTKRNLAIINIP